MTSNAAYWRDRFTALEKADQQDVLKHIKNIDKYYNRAANSLSKDVKYWYSKVAENNDISYAAALKLMKADELEEFHWTLEEYIEYAKLNGLDQRVTKQLVNASARVHLSYYEELKTELLFGVEKVAAQLKKEVEDLLSEKTIDSYLKTAYEIQKGSGSGWYVKPDVNKLKTLITTPWFGDGEVFSSRIWKNKNMLVYNLQREITFMIMRGNAPNKAAAYISKTMQTAKYNAYRLVQTEEAAISALARRQCYKDLGVEEFEIVETLDGHTCEKCAGMDGKHFPMKEYQVGLTAPPFHPNCRGTTCPHFSDGLGTRAARDAAGNAVEVPADMTYEEWKQKFVDISENDDTIKQGHLKINIQLFAEKDLSNQSSNSLKKGIRSINKQIANHEAKIAKPDKYIDDWNERSSVEQEGLKGHWRKEIQQFQQSVSNRVEELEKRGDHFDE